MPYKKNALLRALTPQQLRVIGPLEPVRFRRGEYLYRYDEPVRNFIFLKDGLISVSRPLIDGQDVEIFTYGGGIGIMVAGHTLFQVPESLYDYRVLVDVSGWRVAREALELAIAKDAGLLSIFKRLVHVMDHCIAQLAACRAAHTDQQRLARVLVMLRVSLGDRVDLPRQTIAQMVPCRRTSLYRLLPDLVANGVVRLDRDSIEILDAAALAGRSCECFATLKAMWETLPHHL